MRECKKHNWSFGVNSNFCPDCKIEQLQAEVDRLKLGVHCTNESAGRLLVEKEQLKAENMLLRDFIVFIDTWHATNKPNYPEYFEEDVCEEAIRILAETPQTAKIQAVLDAARECASFYEGHKDFYNEKDTRGFDVGEAMRLLSKCNEAVREYKEE